MTYILGIIAGAVWGMFGAMLNNLIMKKSIKKNTTNAMLICNAMRMAVDAGTLAVVFFLRNVLPFSFVACIVAAAVGLSITTIIYSLRLMKE